jgi:hypothetical protein
VREEGTGGRREEKMSYLGDPRPESGSSSRVVPEMILSSHETFSALFLLSWQLYPGKSLGDKVSSTLLEHLLPHLYPCKKKEEP